MAAAAPGSAPWNERTTETRAPGKDEREKKRAALERPLSGRMLHGLKSTQKYFTLLQSRLGTSGPENLGTETEMN